MNYTQAKDWTKHEILEVIKQASAIVLALSAIGGFLITTWKYFDLPLPISLKQHVEDVEQLRNDNIKQFNALRRMTLGNRIETLQMRVTNLYRSIHDIEDAIAIHKRSLSNPQVTEEDKQTARRRIITLGDELEITKKRLSQVYAHMGKIREAMLTIPYDPKYGDVEDMQQVEFPR